MKYTGLLTCATHWEDIIADSHAACYMQAAVGTCSRTVTMIGVIHYTSQADTAGGAGSMLCQAWPALASRCQVPEHRTMHAPCMATCKLAGEVEEATSTECPPGHCCHCTHASWRQTSCCGDAAWLASTVLPASHGCIWHWLAAVLQPCADAASPIVSSGSAAWQLRPCQGMQAAWPHAGQLAPPPQ